MKNLSIKHISEQIYRRTHQSLKTGYLCIVALLLVSVVQAQTFNISLTDTTVEAILNEIRNQADVNFIYNHEELAKCPKVSLSVSEATLEDLLDKTLKNTGMTYKKVNDTIVITPLEEASNLPSFNPDVLTQILRGTVIDRESKITLPFANVHVLNTFPAVGATTGVEGDFTIEDLPVGRYTIKVSFVGYEDALLPEILVGSAKEVFVSVELSEKIHALEGVEVTIAKGEPLNEMATVSALSFSEEETKRYAASVSDPARMVQVYAGVSGTDDASNEIVIRGNSPNWMLWRLEGVEIPSPNHFSEEGYSSGSISILSSNMLGNSDFYTGAFPAEFGGALSGVFDLNLRNGNNHDHEFTVQAGILGVDLSAEGPFKKGYNGSFLFNYRYSTLSILNNLNIQVSENALPNYQDLSFKFNLPTKKAGTFSIWGIGGLSDSDEKYLPDTTLSEKLENGYTDLTKTGMYATGISHTIFPDNKSFFKTVLSRSKSYSSETLDMMDSLGNLNGDFYDELQSRATRFTSFYNRKLSNKMQIRTGIILNYLDYNYYSRIADDSTKAWNTFLDSKGKTSIYQGYFQTKYKFTDKVLLVAGLHYSHFALNSDNSLEPRLGLRINLPERQKLSFGFGMHSKNENLPVYFVEFQDPDGTLDMPNKSLELTRSTHYVASYEKMLGKSILVKAEAYYQSISKLPVPNNPNKYWSPIFGGVDPDDTLVSAGKGRNYGIELTVQKYFTNNYYFMISNSLFESEYKPLDGNWYNTKYNIGHITNFVGGKEFKWGDNKMFGINTKLIWSGGKRQTPINLQASIQEGETVFESDEFFSSQLKDYFRIDLGFKLHFYKKRSEHVLALDIQNATNRLNTWTMFYNPDEEEIIEYPMAGIIPVLSYRIEF
ncbi:carboxypeptidase-like regulatory domain-containing protein [Bacteroidota bacterium]